MSTITSLLKRLLQFFTVDRERLLDAERRRQEAYLAQATSLSELEARQRAWDRRSGAAFLI